MKKTGKAGFTLVEVLVSLVILGILAAGVLPSLIVLQDSIHRAGTLDQYAAQAQGTADTLVSLLGTQADPAFDATSQLFDAANPDNPLNIGNAFDANLSNKTQYKISKVFDPADPANPDKMLGYTLEVRVYYKNSQHLAMWAFADRRGAKWGVS